MTLNSWVGLSKIAGYFRAKRRIMQAALAVKASQGCCAAQSSCPWRMASIREFLQDSVPSIGHGHFCDPAFQPFVDESLQVRDSCLPILVATSQISIFIIKLNSAGVILVFHHGLSSGLTPASLRRRCYFVSSSKLQRVDIDVPAHAPRRLEFVQGAQALGDAVDQVGSVGQPAATAGNASSRRGGS
jgi:hypothetical protein